MTTAKLLKQVVKSCLRLTKSVFQKISQVKKKSQGCTDSAVLLPQHTAYYHLLCRRKPEKSNTRNMLKMDLSTIKIPKIERAAAHRVGLQRVKQMLYTIRSREKWGFVLRVFEGQVEGLLRLEKIKKSKNLFLKVILRSLKVILRFWKNWKIEKKILKVILRLVK